MIRWIGKLGMFPWDGDRRQGWGSFRENFIWVRDYWRPRCSQKIDVTFAESKLKLGMSQEIWDVWKGLEGFKRESIWGGQKGLLSNTGELNKEWMAWIFSGHGQHGWLPFSASSIWDLGNRSQIEWISWIWPGLETGRMKEWDDKVGERSGLWEERKKLIILCSRLYGSWRLKSVN